MARPLRIEYPGAVYHVTARGNERKTIFRDDSDFMKMAGVLEKNVERHGILLFGYVLMKNHYHILIETPAANLSAFMHDVQSHYTGYFNRKHKRSGHLFQGRFKALIVEKEPYLMELSRYIHLNPVRAGMVDHPQKWVWSSYADYVSASPARKWIKRDWILGRFDRRRALAARKYIRFVEAAISETTPDIYDKVTAQLVLGSDEFVEKIKNMIADEGLIPIQDIVSGRQLARWRPADAARAIDLAATHYGVKPDIIRQKNIRGNRPRQAAIIVFHRYSRWTEKEIGAEFGISYSGVNKSVNSLEKEMLTDKSLREEINRLCSKFTA